MDVNGVNLNQQTSKNWGHRGHLGTCLWWDELPRSTKYDEKNLEGLEGMNIYPLVMTNS